MRVPTGVHDILAQRRMWVPVKRGGWAQQDCNHYWQSGGAQGQELKDRVHDMALCI